jgi:hypothetical protein
VASSINASTTAGVVTTADTSGVLNIQTAGTTAISIDASQAVSFTNAPTVTGGTANGVAYLNGSKVLTTGSALVFDGSNLGVGVTPNTTSLGGTYALLAVGKASGSGIIMGQTDLTAADSTAAQFLGKTTGASGYQLLGGMIVQTDGSSTTNAVGRLTFYTATGGSLSERARIFSGGGISVFSASTANDTIDSCNNQAAGTTYSTFIGRHSATAIATGTVSCRIYTNGNIVNTNNSYGPISDIKLKENIVDATPKLQDLMRVRIVNYNLKTDQTHKQIGVIAQELEQVFAGLVDDHPDMDEQGNSLGTTTKSVKMSVFTPILIKAIQEQQALITTLTARITALESA